METYRIERIAVVGDEQPATNFDLYQPDALGDLQLVDSISWDDVALIADPEGDPEVKYWPSALADSAKAFKVVGLSDAGILRGDELVCAARSTQPGVWTLYAYTVDAGLGVKAGARLVVDCVSAVGQAGEKSIVIEKSGQSDVNGYVAMTVPADAGDYTAKLGAVTKTFSTAGRSGTVVNWATLP